MNPLRLDRLKSTLSLICVLALASALADSAVSFQEQYDALIADVPSLSDKEVVVRLAALVAMVDDGHTPTPGPEHARLEFRQLPLAFEKFDDGIFVKAAREDLKGLIGYRLDSIDGTNADDAFAVVQAITYAENSQLEALMGIDQLSSPDAVAE